MLDGVVSLYHVARSIIDEVALNLCLGAYCGACLPCDRMTRYSFYRRVKLSRPSHLL
jgi:hypothetical protein